MSRSRKKTKIFGIAGVSDKEDKVFANRSLRRNNKMNIQMDKDAIDKRENSNVWDFNKDGKRYWKNATKRDMDK